MRVGVVASLALGACHPEITGSVQSDAGPVVGAVLRAVGEPPCEAVTGPDGSFRARCDPGERRFEVSHPAHRRRELSLVLPRLGTLEVPPITLVAVPTEPGLFLDRGDHFEALGPAPLRRLGSEAEGWRWCLAPSDTSPPVAPPGAVTLLDQLGADWRLFRADAEGCVYRLTPTASGYWSWKAEPVEVSRRQGPAAGRDVATAELSPGDYVLAEWLAGGLVPEPGGEGWRARWLRVRADGPAPPPGP